VVARAISEAIMKYSAFRPVYVRNSMSEARKILDELEQVGHITEVQNVVLAPTSTVVVKFADGRVTRIVYKQSILDRVFGRSIS
jgi:hypothetical protein